jgi:hypothetical protein
MTKRANSAHFQAIRKELAEELGYDPDNLSTVESMRVDVVFGLKSGLDELRARMFDGEKVDTNEMRAIADTLERFLPARPKPEPVLDPRDDPHARLMAIIDNWLAHHETEKAERIAQGLPADAKDARIAELESENARLRGELLPGPDAERTITPPTSAITPPGEQTGGRNLRPQVGPDDHKVMRPKPTIEGKANPRTPLDVWAAECERIEQLRKLYAPQAEPWQPAKPNCPPVAKPGWLTRIERDLANSRAIEHEIMNAPSRVSGEPQPSTGTESWRYPQADGGFFFHGDKGREW